MATLKRQKNASSFTGDASKKRYSQSKLYSYQYQNHSALDILNEYQKRIQNQEWLSSDDRAKYKSAIDDYISSGSALREANKFYGTKYTADEEASWNNSLASLTSSYDEVDKYYSQWRDEDAYRGVEHWLERPSQFDDGYQVGDVTKAIGGTLSDIGTKLGSGLLGIGEAFVDAMATMGYYYNQSQGGGGWGLQAQQAHQQAMATQKKGVEEFVAQDLYDEDAIARMLPDALEPITGINIDQHSVLGGKTDSLVKSSGQMLGAIGLQGLGVPWWMTIGTTAFGGESENAVRQGASLDEAAFSGLVSAGAEILTERLFDGIKLIGGNTLSDTVLKPFINSISNKTISRLVSGGINVLGEGAEEYLSSALSAVGQKLSYASEQEWKNLFSSEDATDAFIGGVVMSLGLGGASAKVSDAIVNTRQGADMQKAFGKGVGAELTAQTLELNGDNKYAQKLNSKLEGGKNLSAYQTGKILGEYNTEVNKADVGKIKAAAEARLTELGETGNVSAIADVIARQAAGEEISFSDRKILKESRAIEDRRDGKVVRTSTLAERVANELNRDNIESGEYSSAWAEGIGTKRVNADVYNLRRAMVDENTVSRASENAAPERMAMRTNEIDDNAKLIEAAARDKIGRIEGFTEETASAMVKGYDGRVSASEYITAFDEAMELGKRGASSREVTKLSENTGIGSALLVAYDAGLQARENVASKATKSENTVLQNTTERGIMNTESEIIDNEGKTATEGIRLRDGGERLGGTNPEGQIRGLESRAGQNQEWREGRGRPADGEAARLLDEGRGREVTVAQLGILNGSKNQKVRVIENEADFTPSMKKAAADAKKQGLNVKFFVGDNILIEEQNGSISDIRGYVLGNTVLARADHEVFTSDQLVRHEAGHDMIAKGQVDIKAVRSRLEKTIGTENYEAVSERYAEAYGRTGLATDDVWEEMICDSLGDMNIFSGDEVISSAMSPLLAEVKAAAEGEMKSPTQTRGSPTVLYKSRDAKGGWGKVYSTSMEALNDAVKIIDSNLSAAFTEEVYAGKATTPIINATIAVEQDVRQSTITPIQGAKLLSEAYEKGGVEALDRLYNHATGNLTPKALERAKQYDTAPEGKASRDIGDYTENNNVNGGIINGTERTEQQVYSTSVHTGRDSTFERASDGTQTENGKRSRVQGTVGEKEEKLGKIQSVQRESTGVNDADNEWVLDSNNYVVPSQDSNLHKAQLELVDEYGIETHIVKASAWKRKAKATTHNEKVYISEDIGDVDLRTVPPHEATHAMKQRGFKPYLEFIKRTPNMLDKESDAYDCLMEHVAEHLSYDRLNMNAKQRIRFYDEVNAAMYGWTVSGVLFEAKYDIEWVTDAFYDFVAYFDELNAIHEQFKAERKAARESDIRYSRELGLIDHINEEAKREGRDITNKGIAPLSNREILANALEGAVQNEAEREKLKEYKDRVDMLNRESFKLSKINEEIKELTFGKGEKNPARLKELKEEAIKTTNRINLHDKKLLSLEATKSLKDVLDREKKKAYKAAAEKGREALHRNVEGRHKTAERHGIKALKDKFIKMMAHPTDKQYIPANLISAMVDVCSLIDTDTDLYKADGSINKAQQKRNEQMDRLLKLRDEYAALGKNPDPMYSGEFAQDILEYLDELRKDYTGKSLAEMTLVELQELRHTLKAIDETLMDARKLIGWGEADNVYEAGDSIIEEQTKIGEKRKQNGISKVDDSIVNLSLSPLRAVFRMAGYNEDSALYRAFREIENGTREQKKFVMDAVKKFEGLTTGKNASTYEKAIYDPYGKELIDKNGKKFHVTKMQMMQAIMSYERELSNDKLHHVSNGGFTFADIKLLGKGEIREAVSAKYAHTITLGVDVAIKFKNELANDKWAQEYMAEARRFFDETAKKAINEANMKLKHRIVATGQNYIPYEVNSDFIVREINSENDIQEVISSYGMLKDLKAGASQPLIITGLNNVLDRHIEQVGNVSALAVPIRNFNKIWNVKSTDGSTTVREKIKSNWGVGGEDLILQAVKDVQGSRKKTGFKWFKTLKSGIITGTFFGNLSVVMKQIGSMYSATSMIDYRNPASMMANLLATKANRDAIAAEVNKYTAVAWVRGQGLSDAELYDLKTTAKKSKVGRAVDRLPTALNAAKWITQMDYDVALSLWKYAKEDTAKRTGLTGEELLKATADYYNDVIENTQSMNDALHRPEIQKRDDIVSEMAGMFKTDLYQNAGLLRVALESRMAKPSKETNRALVKAVGGALSSMCWGALITSVMAALRYKPDRYRDEEDDEITLESWLKVTGGDMLEEMVGYMIPLFGSEAAEIIGAWVSGETYEFDNVTLEAINGLSKAITSAFKITNDDDLEKILRTYKNLIVKATSLFGSPASNVTRFLDAVRLHAQDIANGEFLSFEAGLTSPNNTRLYNAYIEGDSDKIEKASRLYKDEAALKAGLRKGLRENDPRLREAALAKLKGDNSTYKKLCEEVIKEGKFDRTIIIDAFAAEYNHHNTKKKEAEAEGRTYP